MKVWITTSNIWKRQVDVNKSMTFGEIVNTILPGSNYAVVYKMKQMEPFMTLADANVWSESQLFIVSSN